MSKTTAASLLTLLFLVTGCGIGYVQPQHNNVVGAQPTKRVLLFGNSIMNAAAPAITARLAAKNMPAVVKNGAANGASPVLTPWPKSSLTPQQELQRLLDEFDPDIVVANFTGHGFGTGQAAWNRWDAAITAMSSAIRNSGATVYWTIPPYVGNSSCCMNWAAAVWYFAGLANTDQSVKWRQPDWRTALRPQNDKVIHNGELLRTPFAYDLRYPEDEVTRTVRPVDWVHVSASGNDRLARWTTWTLRPEWGIP